jgi:tetratricopeptide (TPR) repeat protein
MTAVVLFSRLAALLIFLALLTPASPAAANPKELLAAGRVDEAVESLQQTIDHSPQDAESYNLLCRAWFMEEAWDRSISACERATALDPKNSYYFLWLGRAYGEKADRAGWFAAAGLAGKVRQSFERAVQLDPTNWQARTDLAEYYLEAPGIVGGGKDKAQAQADALMSLNPAMAHWVAGRIAQKEKDMVAAERENRAAVAVGNGCRAWFDLASFLRRMNRLDEMQETLTHLESCTVDRADALLDAAGLLLRTGRDYPLAVRLLERYLAAPVEEGPAFKAHDVLGQIFERQGDRKAAAEQFRAALSLFRSYARAQEDLNRLDH